MRRGPRVNFSKLAMIRGSSEVDSGGEGMSHILDLAPKKDQKHVVAANVQALMDGQQAHHPSAFRIAICHMMLVDCITHLS